MKHIAGTLFVAMSLTGGLAQADDSHQDRVMIQSMCTPIFSSAQQAQGQIAKLGHTDTSSSAGKQASQLIARGRLLQQQILANRGRPLPGQRSRLSEAAADLDL